jgi:cytochrome c oxidase cbb3-type subunit 3
MANKRIDAPTGVETVGHEWDGIEELNNPLPRWWLMFLYATIAFAIVYMVLYPSLPIGPNGTKGVLGWSSHGQLDQALAAEAAARAPVLKAIAATPVTALPANPQLLDQAIKGGKALFKANCVACHGSGAAGGKGYPNLADDDWLWGGDLAAIEQTITHGIRNPDHDETRQSQMPAFGRDGILQPNQIRDLVAYVRTISHQDPAGAASARGAELFAANCAVCHGPEGKGNREVGAPNLTDGIWLYGGDPDTLRTTITNARGGVMPRWNSRLSVAEIRMLAAYVHSLGGGEATPQAAATAAAPAEATSVQP